MSNDVKNIAYEVKVNRRGQIVIPKSFRAVLGLSPKTQLRMTLNKYGIIELQKIINNIPVSFTLEFNHELRENVFEAYKSYKQGNVLSGEGLKQKLFQTDEK